ncbi:hypothetical protein COJE103337_00985 [Corynebacterium jeikeium]|uniref:Putative secreted protein n=1 Tax=Corynebacterium jeikeium (strain K411) TaxID=306537 RepID=Q4JVC4_CORJK|nr:hypothetical protein [Corynebacterium jeikeium]EEW16409.1 hypothetical protein HMPREF0297_1327 [Corynebacterium jeikeium ATCC 43734]OOD29248.1 hypothetical protein BWP03_10930 [Corynebacterium jeikeium]WCZ53622.1 hypothetical protein CJEIK_05535 [Corynebacterium jeikeium]CAI37233.1 putative secreted protein [Corynebacterium jeikeium K411]SCX15531.1 hypothetical protein CJBVI_1112 [Corynebacterium jeikeium]
MKKFRSATAAALALTTALALSACTPPHEKDGAEREDTATTGPATPSIQSTEEAATEASESQAEATDATEAEETGTSAETEMGGTEMATDNAAATATGAASASGATN